MASKKLTGIVGGALIGAGIVESAHYLFGIPRDLILYSSSSAFFASVGSLVGYWYNLRDDFETTEVTGPIEQYSLEHLSKN